MEAIGLMSGTSLDGVDAAWVETDGTSLTPGPALTLRYDAALRRDLRGLLDRAAGLAENDPDLLDITARLTRRHAEAVAALLAEPGVGAPAVIGLHGQTILHRPAARRTWQIGDAALLARLVGIPVVHDFRSADVAAGGQGAPLAPALHHALSRHLPKPLAVLNIGGVANITWVGETAADLIAFDTGPGNALLDDWALRHTGFPLDEGGRLAAAGHPDAAVLARLIAHPYFTQPPPKSLDRLDFHALLAASGLDGLSPQDGAATLVAFSAGSIARAGLPPGCTRVLVTGGGRRNPVLMAALAVALPCPVEPVEAVGWDGDALEAQAFGLLAVRSLHGLPLSYPGTTGVPVPLTGGRRVDPPA